MHRVILSSYILICMDEIYKARFFHADRIMERIKVPDHSILIRNKKLRKP